MTIEELFYYCRNIILRKRLIGATVIRYIIDEDNMLVILIIRGSKKIKLVKPSYNPSLKVSFGKGKEYSYYNFKFTKDTNYEVIEYYSIRITILYNRLTNFYFFSHRVCVKKRSGLQVIENKYLYEFWKWFLFY